MANAQPKPTALSAEQRRLLHSWLTEFEQTWSEGRLAERVPQLPPPQDPLRRAALVGLVRIDLVRSWQKGRRPSVESYLQAYPELGATDSAPAELVRAEFEQRRRLGESGAAEDLAARFPRLAADMQRWAARPTTLPRAASETINAQDRATAEAQPPAVLPDTPASPRTPPERFGRYHILKTLGKGGMGTVYLAHDTQLDRQVALKVPHFAAEDARGLARFQREARTAAGIHHPNLCPVYDVGALDGIPYLTMAYVEGRPLSALLRGDKLLPQRQVALLVRKLAAALQEAHRQGVVHRDLKPANIMIKPGGEPVIMDFGLAQRAQADDVRLTRHGALVGTPAYMPPEQVSGDTKAMGPACDIYSVGVILYELLTGRLPFDGPLAAVLAQVLFQEPEPPKQHRPDLDPALEAICLKAMAKKIADRYSSMAELHDALGTYARGGASDTGKEAPSAPLLTVPPSVAPVLAVKKRFRKWPWFAGCGAAAGLLLVGILLAVSAGGRATLEIKLDDPEAVVSLDGSEISREKLDQPISLPPGEHTVSVARAKGIETQQFTLERGEKRVVVFRLEKPRPEPVPVTTPKPPVGQPAPPAQPPPPPPQPEIVRQPPREEPKRRRPEILTAEEAQAAFVRAQIPRMRFTLNRDGTIATICVLRGSGGPGLPGGRGKRAPFGAAQQDEIEWVPLAQAGQRTPATDALGLRMVVVAASFPFKKQVEEFRRQLLLPDHGAVLSELVRGKDGEDRPSFRFTGLVIERAVVGRDGKPGPWERLLGKIDPNETVERRAYDLDKAYADLVIQLPPTQRFEKENPKLQPVIAAGRGLVMSLPTQYPGKQYPRPEATLRTILETVRKLDAQRVPPRNLPNFNPFDAPPMKLGPCGLPDKPRLPQPPLKETPLDCCLIRFLDLNVEPGKVYRYRFKVKMANPNYAPQPALRKDTSPDLALPEELVAADWKETPPVSVPLDEFLYAVDQAKVAPKLKIRPGDTPERNQTSFQMQRWVDFYLNSGNQKQSVGDWLVAARFFVERGEYVRTPPTFTLEIPVHRLGNPQLTLDSRRAPRRAGLTTFVPLQFGDESILVDFEGDKERGPYFRTEVDGGKTLTTRIEDKGATEVLILRPDGKLIARNSVTDAADPVRAKRYEDYLKRVEEAKNGPKKPGGNLFDK